MDMDTAATRDKKYRVRLSHKLIRDLRLWKMLSRGALTGHLILYLGPEAEMNTDAEDLGYGGTLNLEIFTGGDQGMWKLKVIWYVKIESNMELHRP